VTGGPVVPQRATLVLPSTGEFDSRTYRIASSLAARGHHVTVLARLAPGLPDLESHPAGYRIVRVHVDAIDGLPLPAGVRRALRWARSGASAVPGAVSGAADAEEPFSVRPTVAGRMPVGGAARLRRQVAGLRRIAAMALVVRSQQRAGREVDRGADLYHSMAYMGVPVGLALARRHPGASVVYDARDIYVDAGNLARLPSPVRRVVGAIERRWARRAGQVVTVNRPYAEVMARRWSIDQPVIVMNCSYRFHPPEPRERRFHQHLGIPAGERVVLYQGGFSPDRGIEQLLDAIGKVPGAVLVLMGYGPLRATLEARTATPQLRGRVYVMEAVAPTELLGWVACADVVAMPIQPSTLNHRLTTPNKLLEAMAAGVPVVASDLPGMADIVREAACGELCDPTSPDSIAAAIRRLLEAPDAERAACAARALAAAHGRYNWETQMGYLLEVYGRLTGQPW
jgi:glycosyltransferase involved in cell wall biosynthesis